MEITLLFSNSCNKINCSSSKFNCFVFVLIILSFTLTMSTYLYVTSNELKNVEEFSTKTLVGINLGAGDQVIESVSIILLS